jgi:hypothetical membrane protein
VTARRQLACGAVAGPLFTLVFVVVGALRPGYSSLRHLVSSLSLGPQGWIQAANFAVTGLLFLTGASGLGRATRRDGGTRWGPRLLQLCAILLVVAGLFATEPVNGYPPGTPDRPITYTFAGAVHAVISAVGFAALVIATMVFGRHFWRRREWGWALYLAASAVVSLAGFILMLQGLNQDPGLVGLTGLFERVAFWSGFGWVTAVSVKLARVPEGSRTEGSRTERSRDSRLRDDGAVPGLRGRVTMRAR